MSISVLQNIATRVSEELARHKATIRELNTQRDAAIRSLEAAGWKKFQFESDYYGSHQEMGEGHQSYTYLFAPGVNFEPWLGVAFAHGSHGANEANEAFDAWLDTLAESEYIEL